MRDPIEHYLSLSLLGLEPVAGHDLAVDQGLGVNSVSTKVSASL